MLNRNALVIGGGISGMGAALELASQGIPVTLVEREPIIGGHAATFACKATDKCRQCSACLLPENMQAVSQDPMITLFVSTEVKSVEGSVGEFTVRLSRRPRIVDESKCNGCGLCIETCPVKPESAIRSPNPLSIPRAFVIDSQRCLRYSGTDCNLCQLRCPTGAIDFGSAGREFDIVAGAIIVATGYRPFDPREKARLGYGRFPGVITGIELERAMLERESTAILPGGRKPRSVAFVQCVGSRDAKIGNGYCSRVCCKYALRLARLIQYREPQTQVTIYYMDIQTGGRDFETVYRECLENVEFVRGVPVEIESWVDGILTVRYEDIASARFSERNHDLVVLSVGMMPREDQANLAGLLGINLDEFGFFRPRDMLNSTVTNKPGIFIAGSSEGPKNISESLAHGKLAASTAIGVLTGGEVACVR